MDVQSVPAAELRQVKELIWTRVCANLKPAEHDEVKSVIGARQIEENQSLFEEVNALAEILGDVRVSTEGNMQKRRLFQNPARSLVENEIRMLMENLRRANQGSDATTSIDGGKAPLVLNKPKDKLLYEYVNTSVDSGAPLNSSLQARPRTPPSRPQSSRSSRSGLSGSEASSYEAAAVVEQVTGQLNAYDVDTIKDHLRHAIDEEKEALLEDAEYLQLCLEDEANLSYQVENPPSLQDLKDFGKKVEGAWVETEQKVIHGEKVDRMLKAADSTKGRVDKMRTLVGESRDFDSQDLRASNGQPIKYLSGGSTRGPPVEVSAPSSPKSSKPRGLNQESATSSPPQSPKASKPRTPRQELAPVSRSGLGLSQSSLGLAPVELLKSKGPLGPVNGPGVLLRTGSGSGGLGELKLNDIKGGPRLKSLRPLDTEIAQSEST
mmetsp:Transcript_22289/g.26809  ORF Transcript_22289/g.26809 Transcript_22289/m.26809 type:complete len:436 (+) Transcript_22289:378-1685(+)|eukprot:CAMPEP_0197862658 /NCGR_PEP_ID=MMETSP1438-20131217/39611_1 /TAXON_ID=1461541 /ORGANISM="Pterosperma sp., Strain CCMP1384" /LENGTH=435 /DNA_ID=CAMNT_0043480303 /DNA_START=317 /DNA_END=1624 /DNA_ORIENTATION=-